MKHHESEQSKNKNNFSLMYNAQSSREIEMLDDQPGSFLSVFIFITRLQSPSSW